MAVRFYPKILHSINCRRN